MAAAIRVRDVPKLIIEINCVKDYVQITKLYEGFQLYVTSLKRFLNLSHDLFQFTIKLNIKNAARGIGMGKGPLLICGLSISHSSPVVPLILSSTLNSLSYLCFFSLVSFFFSSTLTFINSMLMTSYVTLFRPHKYDFNECFKQEEGK